MGDTRPGSAPGGGATALGAVQVGPAVDGVGSSHQGRWEHPVMGVGDAEGAAEGPLQEGGLMVQSPPLSSVWGQTKTILAKGSFKRTS